MGKWTPSRISRFRQEVLIERLTGRWTCRSQGHVYHEKFNPPHTSLVFVMWMARSSINEKMIKPETVKNRIKVYFDQTTPLIEYYRNAGTLIEIDGTASIEEVSRRLLSALKKVIK